MKLFHRFMTLASSRRIWRRVYSAFLILVMVLSAQFSAAPRTVVQAATNTLTLNVTSTAATGSVPVPTYKYLINVDNTGMTGVKSPDPGTGCNPEDPGYPDSCEWVSISGAKSSSPIFTQGNQADFANGAGLDLPPGRYLISVLADGYKLDGVHFTVPLDGQVTVQLQPAPLPDATVRAWVFEDITPTNSAPDAPAEHGLGGFQGHILDYLGEVTTDVYGNPLCTRYVGEDPETFQIPASALDSDGLPVPDPTYPSGVCLSRFLGTAAQVAQDPFLYTTDPVQVGMLSIPHVGTNRYALSAVPPDGSGWVQTTTLEGNHDWDAWVMEGATGLDTEFVVAGEPFPATFFGFVQPTPLTTSGSGEIKGVAVGLKAYVPPKGGIFGEPGLQGARVDHPIDQPWIALTDLGNGDTIAYVGQGNADGSFDIPHVAPGDYSLSYWDEPQDYIFNSVNVTVGANETVDLGVIGLTGWWTTYEGYVFNDTNRNGVMDAGEQGLPNFTLTMRMRENSLMDRGATVVTTDATGHYYMENAYPMTRWLVMEAYNDLYYTTGVTYQADNQPTPTTVLGAGVDVSVLPIIGLSGRLDWGVHAYDPSGTNGIDPRNGGIVGTVSYDTTRNELDPRYAVVEDWQPGISGLTVDLYAPVDCGTHAGAPCSNDPISYELASDGSYAKGQLLNTYVTETWQRPGLNGDGNCVPRDVNNNPLVYGPDQLVTANSADCIEAPLMGIQFQQGYSAVDGNYGFGDGCFNGTLDATDPANPQCVGGTFDPLPGGREYIVSVEIPADVQGRPMYKVTREEDINIGNGDQIIPQVPPPACAGPLHTVDVAGFGTDGYAENTTTIPGVTIPPSDPTDNPTFVDIGASPYEGQAKPLCNEKLVQLNNGKSIVPTFNLFTDVPLPGRFWGLLVDDLNFSSNPKSTSFGEKAGVPFAPIGIYDYTNRLVYTTESDYNGLFDVLLPSTNRISCPTPSGVCANLYRFVGNDPGIPGRLNANFNPQFRTIAAEFEAFPGLTVPADLAPTQVGVTIQLPGGQTNQAVMCTLDSVQPQLFAVSKPYANLGGDSFTIDGQGFGNAAGQVTLDGTLVLPTSSWSDSHIAVSVPASTPAGPHQLKITASNGMSTVNGLTFHVLGEPAFPSTSVLDNFNRANNNNPGANWSANNLFRIDTNTLQVRNGTGNAVWTAGTFGADQEAYFTFNTVSTSATEEGLLLKINGGDPSSNSASWIEVAYKGTNPTAVRVRTKISGLNANFAILKASFSSSFAAGDRLGARVRSDGTVQVFKNSTLIGTTNIATGLLPWPANLVAGGGQIGLRFAGTTNSNFARVDNFGGGSVGPAYNPHIYEVGAGYTFATIQEAVDAATASNGDDLVVVYPGTPDPTNPRVNPRGAYYENLIVTSPLKLQGVGPGGVITATNTTIPGSIIDGSGFAGDTTVADNWRARIDGLTWVGNQNIYEGQTIYLLAQSANQYGSAFKAAVDGFDLTGGDQMGQANTTTQGGAIYANAYVRNLQITNNVIQGNSGSYGTVRIGTPDLPAPDTNQHNENVRVANNRIIANAGTNLAGGLALFAGSDNYEVAANDICGNFSAEYGGGMSVYGFSPNGKIHDNRVYFNQSYDEGGGIMIAGQLPANPATLSPGSGAVNIYNNLVQANLANDDGGGIRFLMAGNYPMNVYNNQIVNNISTHEGGGIALNDAPAVRVYNNTIMRNLTTATALTSNGSPAPAGLSTTANSIQLQATLPGGSPLFSNPLLFNNIFWDNRAGSRGTDTVTGIGSPGDATPINHWDLGVSDGTGTLSSTSSIIQSGDGAGGADPLVVQTIDVGVTFAAWRTNPNFIGAIMVAVDLPVNQLGNYHLGAGSPAIDAGSGSALTVNAPLFDYDNQVRPAGGGYDIGADEAQ